MSSDQQLASNPVSTSNTSFFDKEIGFLRSDGGAARWIAFAALCALVIYLIVIATLGTGPINVFHNDAFWMLDNGWRVLNGQVPHRDFYSPLGPLEYGIIGGGMWLAKGSAQGLSIGFAAFGFVVGVWGWLLAKQRLPALFSSLVTAWLVFTAVSPMPLGFTAQYLSCAMIHNRQGYALLGIVLVECAFARDKARFWGGVSSGAAFILLGFLKLNFFGVAGMMLLVSAPLTKAEFPRLRGLLAGVAGAVLAFALYPRFSLAAFFSDMQFVLHAHSPLSVASTLAGIVICAKSGSVWLVIAMMTALLAMMRPEQRRTRQTLLTVMQSLIVLASGPLFLQTNSLENRCLLASLWIIILLDQVCAIHPLAKEKLVTVVLIALSIGSIATDMIPNFISTFNLVSYQSHDVKAAGIRIPAYGVENLRLYDSTSFYDKVRAGDGDGTYYANCLSDGLNLLKSQSSPKESVLVLGFINPFSYLLQRKPAEGGSSFLMLPTSLTETHMPPVNRVFGNADLMMLPDYQGTHRASDQFIQAYYRNYLLQNFHFVAKSQYWSLYRRNRQQESP